MATPPGTEESGVNPEAIPADTGPRRNAARARYRDALRHRDLRLLVVSFLVDQLGSWSFVVVISVYIFDRTHSTQWLAAAGVCRWAPGLLLASYGGVIADRYERVHLLIVSSLVSAVLMIGMALVVALDGPVVLREYEDFYNRHRPHRTLNQAAPLRPLPDGVTDLDRFRVQRRDRAGGVIHEYRLVA